MTPEELSKLYWIEKKSTRQIAKQHRLSKSTVQYWMKKYKIPRRTASEAQIRYPRRTFSGNESEKAYMLGLCAGDISVYKRYRTIRACTTTSHPAMISLFRNVYEKYGHFYTNSSKGTVGYGWYLQCDLNESFNFLIKKPSRIPKENELFYAFLAGYSDAEGSWIVTKNRNAVSFEFRIETGNLEILRQIKEKLEEDGYHPFLKQTGRKGDQRGALIAHENLYELSLRRRKEVASLAKKILLYSRHEEKVQKIQLILETKGVKYWREIESRVRESRRKIKNEVKICVERARRGYEQRKTGYS